MIAEAASFGVGTLSGAGIKLAGKLLDGYKEATLSDNQIKLAKIQATESGWKSAREFALSFAGGAMARRFIVLTVFSYLFIFPFIASLKEIPINYLHIGEGAGILGWMFGLGEGVKTRTTEGFTILPFQTMIASYVAGFYFGAGTVK